MKAPSKKKADLGAKLEKVVNTPAGFDFYIALHDFVEQVEAHPARAAAVLPAKYTQLKEVHQGIKDTSIKSKEDLGHDRYMVIQDLLRIRNRETSDSNPIWKKREMFRSLSVEVYKIVSGGKS